MYEAVLKDYQENPQVNRLCLVMDIVSDHFKDHNDYVRNKVRTSLSKFSDRMKKAYDPQDPSEILFHQDIIDMFYKSMGLGIEELKKYGSVVYFVDFVGMFNMNIYEKATYYKTEANHFPPTTLETITDLFGKKIADFYVMDSSGRVGAHVFKFKQDCDIFCYFVNTLNENLIKISN